MSVSSNPSIILLKRLLKILTAAAILAVAAIVIWRYVVKPQMDLQQYPIAFAQIVETCAVEYGVPREIVFAVIRTESSFETSAVSASGAKGLMQLMDETNEWIALMNGEDVMLERVFDPEINIRRGVWLLAHHYRQFGSWRETLAAYNAGIGRVQGWLKDPAYTDDGKTLRYIPIDETRVYVERVMEAAEKYREIYYE